MTAAVTVEGALPVELRFGLPDAPVQGGSFPVNPPALRRQSTTGVAAADSRRRRAGDREPRRDFGRALDPGVTKGLEITLNGSTPGIHLVSVDVALDLNGGGRRSFQFPVLVARR
jgi:hypothetical protein